VADFAGDDRHVVDYLGEEVLAELAPDTADFLLRTSVLDRLSAPLADAVLRRDDSASRLAEIERSNLQSVDVDGESPDEIVQRFGALGEAGAQHIIFSVRGVADTSRLERLGAEVFPQLR
jgi:hypothetical protein